MTFLVFLTKSKEKLERETLENIILIIGYIPYKTSL